MIDWNRVRELQDEVGMEDFSEIVTLFLEEVDEATAALAAGGPGGDLAAAMHFLKGCALNLGFRDLASYCAEGEVQAQGGAADQVDLARLCEIYAASRSAFLAQMSTVAA